MNAPTLDQVFWTAVIAVVAVAIVYRVPPARDVVTAQKRLLGVL